MGSNNKLDPRQYKLYCPKCGAFLGIAQPGQSLPCLLCNHRVALPLSAAELAKYEVDRVPD